MKEKSDEQKKKVMQSNHHLLQAGWCPASFQATAAMEELATSFLLLSMMLSGTAYHQVLVSCPLVHPQHAEYVSMGGTVGERKLWKRAVLSENGGVVNAFQVLTTNQRCST